MVCSTLLLILGTLFVDGLYSPLTLDLRGSIKVSFQNGNTAEINSRAGLEFDILRCFFESLY